MDNRVDDTGRSTYCPASAPNPPWVTRLARGQGKPGREPDEPRKTGGRGRCDVRRRRERRPDGPHRHDRQERCLDRPRDPLPTRVEACPDLPPAYGVALDAALAILGIALAGDARTAIDGHIRLLLAWNDAINLTAIRDPAAVAIRHVVDSLTGLEVLRARDVDRFVDLGSGGGFPGLTLAAALPADRALLVDSVAKKVRFLSTVAEATGLDRRTAAVAERVEALAADPRDRGRWPAATARAVASLADLVELALPLLRPGGVLVAWKRGDAVDLAGFGGELVAGRRALAEIDPGGHIEVGPALAVRIAQAGDRAGLAELAGLAGLADHRLVVVERSDDPIAGSWPRDPATRRRFPL